MPFTEHLAELRLRLRNAVLAVLLATAGAWLFRIELYGILIRPLARAWAQAPPDLPREITFTNLIDPFMVYFKLALLAGVFAASPAIFHQVWRFIAPGLYPRERRLALPFILLSVLLFCGGALFAFYFVLPASYGYFLSFCSSSLGEMRTLLNHEQVPVSTELFRLRPMLTMDEYFGLTSTLLLLFGAVFELPLLLSALALFGIVTPGGLWRFNRYAILIFFILGAILTPGDLVVGQLAMGSALTVLYNLSILAALLMQRQKDEVPATAR